MPYDVKSNSIFTVYTDEVQEIGTREIEKIPTVAEVEREAGWMRCPHRCEQFEGDGEPSPTTSSLSIEVSYAYTRNRQTIETA